MKISKKQKLKIIQILKIIMKCKPVIIMNKILWNKNKKYKKKFKVMMRKNIQNQIQIKKKTQKIPSVRMK